MNVRQLIDQLKALGTPDAEVFALASPYPDEANWPITGMIHGGAVGSVAVVGLTGENND